MSDQEFETFREFENLDFLFSLATPVLQIVPNHFWVLFKYNCQFFGKGELHRAAHHTRSDRYYGRV
jgi:hypothetical protein